jgi:hypothetical protein
VTVVADSSPLVILTKLACPWRITELGREGLDLTDVTSYMASLYVIHFNGAPDFDEAQLTVSTAICVLVDEGFPAESVPMSRTLVDIYQGYSFQYPVVSWSVRSRNS